MGNVMVKKSDSRTETPMTNAADTTDAIAWNDAAIMAAAGESPESVRAILVRHKQPAPTDYAVYQWSSRRLIPNQWRPRLVYALLRENRIDVGQLFRVGSCARHKTRTTA